MMRRISGFIVLIFMLAFGAAASAQSNAMFKSDDGLLKFQYPAEWTQGEVTFDDSGYSVPFTLPDADVTIKVINADSPDAFFEAQRKDTQGFVSEFAVGDFNAIASTLTNGDYQIAFAPDESHVVAAVIHAANSDAAAAYEQPVADVLATLQFTGSSSGTQGARIESPILNIGLPEGWESSSNQLQGDYFQFLVTPSDGNQSRFILIEILDLEARGLVDVVQNQGVGALMSQLPGGDKAPESLTIGGFDVARTVGFNESSSSYMAYSLFVVEKSWLVAASAAAESEEAINAILPDVDAIITEMENGITLDENALSEVVKPTIEGVEYFPNLTPTHVRTPVDYPQTPPVGGPHNPVWQTCGVYDAPLKNEHAVHSLEHGAVWITYQPDLPADEVEALANIVRRGTHRLLSPYPGIDSPIILSAWGYQLKLDSVDDPRLLEFIQQYEQGPTTPELGASCSGGETRTADEIGG